MLRVGFFDLDDTLYSATTGLWDAIGERINLYMIQRLGLAPAVVSALRDRYFRSFGSTLNGLRTDFHIDPEDYLAFVHDLPLDTYLRPDPALDGMLARLPLTNFIFTNADAAHAERVLQQLGIAGRFTRIIDIHVLEFINKPDARAYARALALAGCRGEEALFADDTPRNLPPAQASGMLTLLVDARGQYRTPPSGADYILPSILGLERVVAGVVGQAW